jgi:FlaG/FlaF family flagellin (archaellin)
MTERAVSTIPAIVLLTLLTIALGVGIAATSQQVHAAGHDPCQATPIAVGFTVDGPVLRVTHLAGPPLSLDNATTTITVDGDPLRHQPPLPFFAARGFQAAPTGAFNSGSDGTFSVGEDASMQIAQTNHPWPDRGSAVRLMIRSHGCTTIDVSARS